MSLAAERTFDGSHEAHTVQYYDRLLSQHRARQAGVRWFDQEVTSWCRRVDDHFTRIDEAGARIDAVLADYRSIR